MNSKIEALKKSIQQWKIIYELSKEKKYPLDYLKKMATRRMGYRDGTIRCNCFLCEEFVNISCIFNQSSCFECPMYGHWPSKFKIPFFKRKKVKVCYRYNTSLYSILMEQKTPNHKLIKIIIEFMEERLNELTKN